VRVSRRRWRSDLRFAILDAGHRVGDAWRARWDSLRLFTPARFSALPGLPIPGPPDAFPTKDQVADYLQAYAEHFDLPVMLGHRVTSLDRDPGRGGGQFRLTVNGRRIHADHVVVATGGTPRRPVFASDVAPEIVQLHASEYHRPDEVPPGPVLVVGAGNSGAEIALDLALDPAGGHSVRLAGRDTGRIPLITGRWYWWLIHHRLNVDTRPGRAFARVKDRGTPLVRIRPRHLTRAGVNRTPKVTGVRNGLPLLLALVVSTVLAIAVGALTFAAVARRSGLAQGDE